MLKIFAFMVLALVSGCGYQYGDIGRTVDRAAEVVEDIDNRIQVAVCAVRAATTDEEREAAIERLRALGLENYDEADIQCPGHTP